MSVWFAIPSARPAAEATKCLDVWRAQGYHIAVMRQGETIAADIYVQTPEYLGWARSVNALTLAILDHDSHAEWIVSGGDDTWPDPNHTADEIALECSQYFAGKWRDHGRGLVPLHGDGIDMSLIATFGVMQPTGDRWGADEPVMQRMFPNAPAYIDRIAGSPWLGREWCKRAYQGKGPLWGEYHHCWADEELQNVAIKLGVFWQRPDLIHMHKHVARVGSAGRLQPELERVISEDYTRGRPLFLRRQAAGWPGSDPLP